MSRNLDTLAFFQELRSGRDDVLLHDSQKQLIQELIDVLQDEYNKVILDPQCTEYDALEYILLFTLEGAIAATKLGSNMDEYLIAADIYAGLLGLYGDEVRDKYFKNTQNSDTLEQNYEKLAKDKKNRKDKKNQKGDLDETHEREDSE